MKHCTCCAIHNNYNETRIDPSPSPYQMQKAIAMRVPITAVIPVRMMPISDVSPLVFGVATGVPATDTIESTGLVIGEPKGVFTGMALGELEGD